MRTIYRGSVGADVRAAQEYLLRYGFDPGSVDGVFGAQMEAAVRAFQAARGLAADGVVDPGTWAALRQAPEPDWRTWYESERARRERAEDKLQRIRAILAE